MRRPFFALLFLGDLSWWALRLPAWACIWIIVHTVQRQRTARRSEAGTDLDRSVVLDDSESMEEREQMDAAVAATAAVRQRQMRLPLPGFAEFRRQSTGHMGAGA